MKNDIDARVLVDRIDALREPYRRNAIEWVESCVNESMSDLPRDMRRAMNKMAPVKRKEFYSQTVEVLEGAARHFGR